ncbi:MAG TPA: PadR family transcriptional regulator [Bellilinea sp.]|nr:PadR family transcriptional regulator [Bellilinea sp.]
MNPQFAFLGILTLSPNYGYELKKTYDRLFGRTKPILAGQVYSTLSRLERDGRVEEQPSDEKSGGPDRIRYAITPKGSADLQQWLETAEEPAPQLTATLYMKTVLALLKGGDAAAFLDNQRHAHIARMRELTAQRRDSALADVLLIDHAIFHLEADLRWIDLTSSRLEKLKEELCLTRY